MAKAAGRSLVGELDDLARAHGLYATDQLSVRVDDLSLIPAMMTRLREQPPTSLAGSDVTEVQDLADGTVATTGLPPTDGMLLATADDARVIVRPSGTEPKLKCYIEVIEQVASDADDVALGAVRAQAAEHLARIVADMREALGA